MFRFGAIRPIADFRAKSIKKKHDLARNLAKFFIPPSR
jgi:hypothetical protein